MVLFSFCLSTCILCLNKLTIQLDIKLLIISVFQLYLKQIKAIFNVLFFAIYETVVSMHSRYRFKHCGVTQTLHIHLFNYLIQQNELFQP